MSAAICTTASAGPPLACDPITSATVAPCAGVIKPTPHPATSAAARNSGTLAVKPSQTVAPPETTSPASIGSRRPIESTSRPENTSTVTVPAAKTDSATPARDPAWCSTSTTNSGTSETRTP